MNREKSATSVITITANAMKGRRIGLFDTGINEVVTKPIDREQLTIVGEIQKSRPSR